MVEPTGIIGLIGLFNTCLEGYKICLTISSADEDVKRLGTRMFLEKERFLNVGKTCGLLALHDHNERTQRLRRFLEEDALRRRAINDTLELIASFLLKAETLDRKYEPQVGLPEALKDEQNIIKGTINGGHLRLRTVLKKFTWSIRDKAAYRELLDDLVGFNDTLEKILPGPMQDFLETVLPATACASSNESELPSLEEASAQHAFLKSQVQWTSSVHAIGVIPRGTQLDEKTLEKCDEIGRNKNCYLAKRSKDKSNEYLLVDWSPWETASKERTERMGSVSGLLGESKCKELRLLTCLGYLEEQDTRSQKCRYALVYDLMVGKNSPSVIATAPRKLRTLSQLLENFKTVQFPPLETRLLLARSLCRAMLLYHSSGWIHHDFRSHNVILVGGSAIIDGTAKTYAADYQGLNMDELFIIGLGHSRDEADVSLMFADRKAISKTLKQQRRYWSPDYLLSSGRQRTARMFQRSHDIYSLGCVLLEIGVWRPLESYTWESAYDEDHTKWHKRLLREEGKLRAMCGSRYTEAVMTCLNWTTSDIGTDVQNLAFDILLKLEEIMV